MTEEKEKENMIAYTFRLPPNLLDKLKNRAGFIPVSVIIRRLIEKYINGEISLD